MRFWRDGDDDRDGLSNEEELPLGTLPGQRDTDEDNLDDGDEVDWGTDPLRKDTDGDGLSDGEEDSRGLNPLDRDTDGDGENDGQDNRPNEVEIELTPDEFQGLWSDGTVENYGGLLAAVGDAGDNLASRAFLTHEISTIPADATIIEAVLDMTEPGEGDFFHNLGSIGSLGRFEIFKHPYGELERTDIDGRPTTELYSGSVTYGPASMTEAMQQAIDEGDRQFQLRMQFSKMTDDDGNPDFVVFILPTLTVRYQPYSRR